LHPAVGGGLAFAWLDSSRFDPRRMTASEAERSGAGDQPEPQPAEIAAELESSGNATGAGQ
jgi:hypothetical protein